MWNYKKALQKQREALESLGNLGNLGNDLDSCHTYKTMSKLVTTDAKVDIDPSVKELIKLRADALSKALKLNGYELITDDSPENLRKVIESAGNKIGSVHFIKRSTGKLRKMSYRLHVTNPRYAKKPMGKKVIDDVANTQMTVFDTNKVIKDKETGEVIGRGAWRTIPLENVVRIAAGGKTYLILPRYESEDQEIVREFFYV